jgi:hypothetical protein
MQQQQQQQRGVISRKLSLMDVKEAAWFLDELLIATGRDHVLEQRLLWEREQLQQQQQGSSMLEEQQPEQQQDVTQGQASAAVEVHQVDAAEGGQLGLAVVAQQTLQQQQQQMRQQQQQIQQQQQGQQAMQGGSGGCGGSGAAGHDVVVPTDGVARHGFTFGSCYADVLGTEPEYTSSHDRFFGTLDYMWYTTGDADEANGSDSSTGLEGFGGAVLRPKSVLLPPPAGQHMPWGRHMPNGSIPSDHISLVVDMELRRG